VTLLKACLTRRTRTRHKQPPTPTPTYSPSNSDLNPLRPSLDDL
jgi:hypothetical protein